MDPSSPLLSVTRILLLQKKVERRVRMAETHRSVVPKLFQMAAPLIPDFTKAPSV